MNWLLANPEIKAALEVAILSLLAYVTFWLKSHVGKSNGDGSLNDQVASIAKKLDDHIADETADIKTVLKVLALQDTTTASNAKEVLDKIESQGEPE